MNTAMPTTGDLSMSPTCPHAHMLSDIPGVLIGAAKKVRDAHPDDNVAIAVGSSSQAMHRVVGSVAISLARHAPVPLVVVPNRTGSR